MVTAGQKAILKQAADAAGLDLSAWIRSVALREAGAKDDDHRPTKRR